MSGDLSDILNGPEKSDLEQRAKQSEVWNIFVQVLLPLLMISMFFAFWAFNKYKNDFEKYMNAYNKCKNAYDEHVRADAKGVIEDSSLLENKLAKSEIELQRKKLLEALNSVIKEEYGSLNYYLVQGKSGERIVLDGYRLDDTAFSILCEKAHKIFSTDNDRSKYFTLLFNRVLSKCSLSVSQTETVPTDDNYTSSRFRSLCDETFKTEDMLSMYQFKQSIITPGNTCFIKGCIREFIDSTENGVVNLERNVYCRMFACALNDRDYFTNCTHAKLVDFYYKETIETTDTSYGAECIKKFREFVFTEHYWFLENAMQSDCKGF